MFLPNVLAVAIVATLVCLGVCHKAVVNSPFVWFHWSGMLVCVWNCQNGSVSLSFVKRELLR